MSLPAADTPPAEGDDPCGALGLRCSAHRQAGEAQAGAGHHELAGGEAAADSGGTRALALSLS